MKQVVVKRLMRQADSTVTSQFEDFAGFYGFKPILCRPYRGQTKGKVERTVSYVRDNFMVGIKYESLDDLNRQAMGWLFKVNGKIHGTTNEIPSERLVKERLSPLVREYIVEESNERKVEKECLVSYQGNKYSVPAEYVGKVVAVVVLGNKVAAYSDGKQIAVHGLSQHKNEMIVSPDHYRQILVRQSFDVDNIVLNGPSTVDFKPLGIDLGVYDV
jgi:hypothetical protein